MKKQTKKTILWATVYLVAVVLAILNLKLVIAGANRIGSAFEPFLLGLVIAFFFNKPSMAIEKLLSRKIMQHRNRKVTRFFSMIFCYAVFFTLLIFLISSLLPELISSIQDISKNFEAYALNMQTLADEITASFGLKTIDLKPVFQWTAAYADNLAASISDILTQLINLTATGMIWIAKLLLSIVFSVYFLFGKERLLEQGRIVFRTYLNDSHYKKASRIFHLSTDTFSNYFFGQIIEASILSVICFAGMLLFGFHYPVLISALVGLTALVPMIGPYIGGLIGFRILVIIDPLKAVWFIVFLILLQQFEGNVIYPRIVGKRIGLPGVWVLFAISVGAGIAGVVGILLAVPIASILYALLNEDIAKRRRQKDYGPKSIE